MGRGGLEAGASGGSNSGASGPACGKKHRPMGQGAARLTLRPPGPSYSHQQPGASAACSPTGLAQSLRAGNVAEDGGKLTRLLGAIPLQPAGCALPHPVLLFPWHLGGHVQEGLWGPYSLALCPWEVSCQTRGRES